MNCIEIDLETRSDRDITKCGVYAYADSPYFAITLMSISVDGGEVQQYDFTAGDTVPEDILRAYQLAYFLWHPSSQNNPSYCKQYNRYRLSP